MAKHSENSQLAPRSARRGKRVGRACTSRQAGRRGHITTFLLFALPLALLTMALVLNWLFAAMTNRRTQHLNDVLALVGVSALLDEEVLQDNPPNDADDAADASALVAQYLMFNNEALAERLRPAFSDLTITPGRVDDVEMPVTGANFDDMPAPDPFNTLRIKIERPTTGTNPVELIMRNFQGVPEEVDIFTVAYATLDSRLTGFAPEITRPTPLVPLAILDSAWFTARPGAMDDTTNANGRYELNVDLLDSDGLNSGLSPAAPNGALIDFDDAAPIDYADMPSQITGGVFPADLAGGSIMATPGSPFMNVGSQTSPLIATGAIAAAFNTVAASSDPRRIFPIYSSFGGGEATLVGFVGATVLSASDIGMGGATQLRVRVEPNFIVHVTATTDPAVDENLYIHKIRLTR